MNEMGEKAHVAFSLRHAEGKGHAPRHFCQVHAQVIASSVMKAAASMYTDRLSAGAVAHCAPCRSLATLMTVCTLCMIPTIRYAPKRKRSDARSKTQDKTQVRRGAGAAVWRAHYFKCLKIGACAQLAGLRGPQRLVVKDITKGTQPVDDATVIYRYR